MKAVITWLNEHSYFKWICNKELVIIYLIFCGKYAANVLRAYVGVLQSSETDKEFTVCEDGLNVM